MRIATPYPPSHRRPPSPPQRPIRLSTPLAPPQRRRLATRHRPTRLGAPPARLRARLTMLVRVLAALHRARLADLRAQPAGLLRKRRLPRHLVRRKFADIRATPVQLDTPAHHLHLFLPQARARALLARRHTRLTRLDAHPMFPMIHKRGRRYSSLPLASTTAPPILAWEITRFSDRALPVAPQHSGAPSTQRSE